MAECRVGLLSLVTTDLIGPGDRAFGAFADEGAGVRPTSRCDKRYPPQAVARSSRAGRGPSGKLARRVTEDGSARRSTLVR